MKIRNRPLTPTPTTAAKSNAGGLSHELTHAVQQNTAQIKSRPAALDRLKEKSKLESEDKLGNFEIQDLMSQYNQAEQLATNVRKKRDETGNSVIGKV